MIRVVIVGLALALGVAGCSSSGSSSGQEPSGAASGAPVEVNPPGDIPDDQAFVAYQGSGFTAKVPEGWARSTVTGGVVFNDKYNSITLTTTRSPSAPTVDSARGSEVPDIQSHTDGYQAGKVTTTQRRSGTAVLITYRARSAVNPVTGKVAEQDVERYEFWRAGTEVILTLAAPVGSDNVDPWRTVTDSFAWT